MSKPGWTLDTLKEVMDERDKRYKAERKASREAVRVLAQNNAHWKGVVESVIKEAAERERNFVPKSIGAVLSIVSVISMIVAIAAALH